MKKTRNEVITYINSLDGYEGYVQFSHRPIDMTKDIFMQNSPKVEDESGFIYEAHFSNGTESIAIRQINDSWLVSQTNIENIELETYYGIDKLKVNMAQVWEVQSDELCEGMEVKKLSKVVFAGFEKGELT